MGLIEGSDIIPVNHVNLPSNSPINWIKPIKSSREPNIIVVASLHNYHSFISSFVCLFLLVLMIFVVSTQPYSLHRYCSLKTQPLFRIGNLESGCDCSWMRTQVSLIL